MFFICIYVFLPLICYAGTTDCMQLLKNGVIIARHNLSNWKTV